MNLYSMKKKIISLVLFCLIGLLAYGQGGLIEGTVISSSGDSLENARITLRENPIVEVYTDAGGAFSLSAQAGQHLVIEYKNRYNKVVSVDQLMEDGLIHLGEDSRTVSVGFNSKKKQSEIASSIGVVRNEQLEDASVHMPGNALFGKLQGLRVFQSTGDFPWNRAPSMDIRGRATTGNTDILVLVDGVERPINTVVLEEIESVTVLRDAASKAQYGQRGANGVLLINTKRGSKSETTYNVSFDQGVSQPSRLPEFLEAPAYARAVNQARANDGLDPRYSELDIERFESGAYPSFWPNVDWVDQTLSDMGQYSRFNFSASGGNEDVNFYMGINYQNDHGMYKHTEAFEDFSTQLDYDKLNFRTNLDMDLTSTTFAQINLAGYVRSGQRPARQDIVGDAFATPSAMFPVKNYDGSWGGTNQFGNNPVASLSATGMALSHIRSFLVDLRLQQDLTSIAEGLSAEIFVGYDNQANFWENKTKQFRYSELIPVLDAEGAIIDTIVNELGEDTDLSPGRNPGDVQSIHYDFQGKINYSQSFGDHDIDGWLLLQQEEQQLKWQNQKYRRRNLAGNVHYRLADKYFLDATVSYYGTNRIQDKNERYGLFPAVAGAWMVSRESFMSGLEFLDALKLKASYGKAGNGRITMSNLTSFQYGWSPGYVYGDNYNNTGGLGENQIPINRKTFETSTETNIGLEARLFDKLELTGEWFYVKREDIMVSSSAQYSDVLGILPEAVPAGEVENKGYELGLTWSDQVGDFNYYLSGTFSHYRNKIININEEFRPYDYMKREGEMIGQHFGWESDGFYADQADIDNSATSQFGVVQPGDVKYVDQNGDGVIDQFDQVPIGNSFIPEIYYSASLGMEYKGLELTATFQGNGNTTAYLSQAHVFWPLQGNNNMSTWYDNYWTPENKANAELPRLTTESNDNNFRKNNIWLRDNSFLKLRYAQLSYSLPKQLIGNFNLEKVKIYLQGRNLFSVDDVDYLDPEATWAHYPALRTYTAGINVTF